MMTSVEKPHVVAVPFPAMGHSIPLLDLVKLLAAHGVTISYVTTSTNVSRLQRLTMDEPLSSALNIHHVVVVDGLPEGVETFDGVRMESCGLIYELVDKLEEPFDRWMEQQFEKGGHVGAGPPVCIIQDALVGWTLEGAKKRNIPRMVFNTFGAFGLCLLYSSWRSASQNALKKYGDGVMLNLDLPNPMRLHEREIDPLLFDSFVTEIIGRLQSITRGCGMLVNTFEELEPEYLQHLKDLTGKPVWPVGPLLPLNFIDGEAKPSARGKLAEISDEELLHWLESQARDLLYIFRLEARPS